MESGEIELRNPVRFCTGGPSYFSALLYFKLRCLCLSISLFSEKATYLSMTFSYRLFRQLTPAIIEWDILLLTLTRPMQVFFF